MLRAPMSKFFWGNVFLGLSVLSSSLGQVALKSLMTELDGTPTMAGKLQQLLVVSRLWKVGVFGVGVGLGFLAWMACLSKLDLSYAYTVACGSALLVSLLSVFFLGETPTPKMWFGAVLIITGTALLVPSK